jgi:hypothetical protein
VHFLTFRQNDNFQGSWYVHHTLKSTPHLCLFKLLTSTIQTRRTEEQGSENSCAKIFSRELVHFSKLFSNTLKQQYTGLGISIFKLDYLLKESLEAMLDTSTDFV